MVRNVSSRQYLGTSKMHHGIHKAISVKESQTVLCHNGERRKAVSVVSILDACGTVRCTQ